MNEISQEKMEEQFRLIMDFMPGGICVFRPGYENDAPVFTNSMFLEILEVGTVEEIGSYTGGDFWKIFYAGDLEKVRNLLKNVRKNAGAKEKFECRVITKTGSVRLVRALAQCNIDSQGIETIVIFMIDVGLKNILNLDTGIDPLTGLVTMRTFFKAMEQYREKLGNDEDSGIQLTVLFYDLVNFSSINIHYGIDAGDDFLNKTGILLREIYPEYIVSHFDSDRFVVLTDMRNLDSRVSLSRKRIKNIISGTAVDCSVGACVWSSSDMSPEVICDRAKIACDNSRKNGSLYFSYYDENMGDERMISEYVVSNIEEAVENGWIKVYYQPEIRALTNELCGLEALARWNDPVVGFLSPDSFIEPLENAHKIWLLDLYVIRQVVQTIAMREKNREPEVHFSINLSRIDFLCCDMFSEIESLIRRYDVPRRVIHLEVTESTITSSETAIMETLDKFRDAGYEIWMDDFGSGYSTLNLLKDYSFDLLKIDMAFLRNDSERARDIISSVIEMDKKIGNLTLAEGVETEEQCEFLRQCGCDCLQGYYFGMPQPYEETMKCCAEKGIAIEKSSQKEYLNAVSSVNFMSSQPMMLMEYQNKSFRIVFMNYQALDLIKQYGNEDSGQVEKKINDSHSAVNGGIIEAAEYAVVSGDGAEGEIQYPLHDREILCHYKLLKNSGAKHMFEVKVFYVRIGEVLSEYSRLTLNLRYLYKKLYIIDLKTFTLRSLGIGTDKTISSGVPIIDETGKMSALLPSIFKGDQQRYDGFMDASTIRQRFQKQMKSVIGDVFRTEDTDEKYRWMVHLILSIPNTDDLMLFYAVRPMNVEKVMEEIHFIQHDPYAALIEPQTVDSDSGFGTDDKNRLWDDMMLNIPLPVFWKDRKLRYLGANKYFLDYCGFDSCDNIIGKSDEDLRWNPDNEIFRQNEMKVIRSGEVNANNGGKFIIDGIARNITSTVWPLYHNSSICGIMGYFIDDEMMEHMTNVRSGNKNLDPVTRVGNITCFLENLSNYNVGYQISGRPFGAIFVEIPQIQRIIDSFGINIVFSVMKICAGKIRKIIGNIGIVSRISLNQFTILCEYKDSDEMDEYAEHIRRSIESIREVDGIKITVFTKVWVAKKDRMMNFNKKIREIVTEPEDRESEFMETEHDSALKQFLDAVPLGCYIISSDDKIIYWNDAAEQILGFNTEQTVGLNCFNIPLGCSNINGVGISELKCPAIAAFATGSPQTVNMFMRSNDGRNILIQNMAVPISNDRGEISKIISLFTPVADETIDGSILKDIYEIATRDPVTCLPGRKFMENQIKDDLEVFRRTGDLFAVLFADADNFHDINNQYGHAVGDDMLKGFGAALMKYGRKIDHFCRWGGDEFVGLLHMKRDDDLERAAKRFEKVAENISVTSGNRKISIHVSIGITVVREEDDDKSIIERADKYMYLSKKFKGRVVVSDINVRELTDADNENI